MKEIKFRAWEIKLKKIAPWKYILKYCDRLTFLSDKRWIFMQYTGLKDKNGKEIFEGDIIKFHHIAVNEYRQGVVKYGDKWATFYIATKNRHGVGIALDSVHQWYYKENDDGTECEIIGNIHENPQLLEDVK